MSGAGAKRKGNGYEREVVKRALEFGVKASRSWGSDGRSRGMIKDVDVVFNDCFTVQCKRIKQLPQWLGLVDGISAAVVREDNGQSYAIVRLNSLLTFLGGTENAKAEVDKG